MRVVGLVVAVAFSAQARASSRASTAVAAVASRPSESATATTTGTADERTDTGWIASEHPDLRKLTVLVRVKPPSEIAAKYAELATREPRLKPFFQAAAEGGFGSGFLLVRRERSSGSTPAVRRFIVTNWHVADLATRVAISFDGSTSTIEVPVVYVDPVYDLAVLSLDHATGDASAMSSIPAEGFDFAPVPAKDQEPVVASGYPPIGTAPSYQVTRGYVSNERFELEDGGHKQLYVQHTAPIDPGSSGGPLTTPDGKLLGVNTMKVRRRENVGLAVPASVVAEAVKRAVLVTDVDRRPGSSEARAACNELVAALARGQDELATVERAIGAPMLAREGFSSLDGLPQGDVTWAQAFVDAPTQVLLHATALRLIGELAPAGAPTCEPVSSTESDTPSFKVRTRSGDRAWTFGWEQRRWKLVGGSLTPPRYKQSFFRDGSATPRKKWTPSFK
jgi:serine protease Do